SGLRGRSLGKVSVRLPGPPMTVWLMRKFRSRRFAVEIGRIARIELAAAIRAEAIDGIEIERRRAEILDCVRVGLLLAERRKVQRDVVVDELAQIGEAGGHGLVVAGGIAGIGIAHRVGELAKRSIAGRSRPLLMMDTC